MSKMHVNKYSFEYNINLLCLFIIHHCIKYKIVILKEGQMSVRLKSAQVETWYFKTGLSDLKLDGWPP